MCSGNVIENQHNFPFNIAFLVEVSTLKKLGLQIFHIKHPKHPNLTHHDPSCKSRFPFLCPFHGLYDGIEAYNAGL